MRIESDFSDYYDHCYNLNIVNDETITFKRYTKGIVDYHQLDYETIRAYAISSGCFFPKRERFLMKLMRKKSNVDLMLNDPIKHYGWDGYFLLTLSFNNCFIDTFYKNPHLRSMFNIVGFCDYLYTCLHLPEIYYDRKAKVYYIVYDQCYYINNKHYPNKQAKQKIRKLYDSVSNIENLFNENYYYHESDHFVKHFNTIMEATNKNYRSSKFRFFTNHYERDGELYAFRFISRSATHHTDLFERLNSAIFSLTLDSKQNHWRICNNNDDCYGLTFPCLKSMNFDKVMDSRSVYKTLYEYVTT